MGEAEHTIFRPMPTQQSGSVPPAAAGAPADVIAWRSQDEEEDEKASLPELVSFAWRAAKRRKLLTFTVLLLVAGITALAVRLVPRTYASEGRIIVLRSQLTASLATAQNQVNADDKRDAKEFEQQILSRANIAAIVEEAKLVDSWNDMRSPLRHLLDEMGAHLGDPNMSDKAKEEALINKLERALTVNIDLATVIIAVDWSEPKSAQKIVEVAMERFKKARFESEVGVIPEAIKILDEHVEQARLDLAQAADDVRKSRQRAQPPLRQGEATVTRQVVREAQVDPRLVDVQNRIRDLSDAKARRLAELRQQQREMSTKFGPAYPEMIALQAQIDAAQQDPPELSALKRREVQLQADSVGAEPRITVQTVTNPTRPAPELVDVQAQPGTIEAQRFESALKRYDGLEARIDAAQIELKTANAAFEHKYQVVRTPEVPTGPKKPVALMVTCAGVLSGLLLILIAASTADLMTGLFFESRRVRDRLRLPVLGEVRPTD
jgi:uncharacterized protein involved in exopolysaccharide biosynthesis